MYVVYVYIRVCVCVCACFDMFIDLCQAAYICLTLMLIKILKCFAASRCRNLSPSVHRHPGYPDWGDDIEIGDTCKSYLPPLPFYIQFQAHLLSIIFRPSRQISKVKTSLSAIRNLIDNGYRVWYRTWLGTRFGSEGGIPADYEEVPCTCEPVTELWSIKHCRFDHHYNALPITTTYCIQAFYMPVEHR